MENQEITQIDVGTVEAANLAPVEDTRTEAQKKAQEILAARAKGKPVPAGLAAPSAPKEQKIRQPSSLVSNTGYRFVREIDPTVDKFNRQQAIIIEEALKLVDNIEGSPTNGVFMRTPLIAALEASAMITRQPHERVFGFYLNGWKKNTPAVLNEDGTTRKAEIPALLEAVQVVPAAAKAPVAEATTAA